MEYILTSKEIRNADSIAINEYGIPGALLMENAARSVSDTVLQILSESELSNPRVLILTGSGNNGGDGYALARHLSNLCDVEVLRIGLRERMSPETSANLEIIERMGLRIHFFDNEDFLNSITFDYDIIFDALIGVGGDENLTGLVVPILQKANNANALKVAIDIPSGLNANTGISHKDAFCADLTITMFAAKTGMFLGNGPDLCGEIEIASLGAPERIIADISKIAYLEDEDVRQLIPTRNRISSKFDYGKVLIIAGSESMPGAAALCANAAIKSGAGLVYLMTPSIHPSLKPEIIPTIIESDENGLISYNAKNVILNIAQKSDVIVFGPGMGFSAELSRMLDEIISELPPGVTIILDADAIKSIKVDSVYDERFILTPHLGEFSNLIQVPRSEIEKDHHSFAVSLARKLNCTLHLKHIPSISTNGNFSIWNLNGNPGMATAGSGDVLSGIIAGLAAQGLEPLYAASVGAFLHSRAGDLFAEEISETSLTASDIITFLDLALGEYED